MSQAHTQSLAFGETADTLYLLVTHGKKCRVVELQGGERVRDFSAPSGMWMMTSFVAPGQGLTLALASRAGKTYVVVPGKRGDVGGDSHGGDRALERGLPRVCR